MIADIASGETASADLFFLVALIIFVVSAIVAAVCRDTRLALLYQVLIATGLASVSLAFLLL